MPIPKPTSNVEAEIYSQIAANGGVFAQWLNGAIPLHDVAVVTDLFSPDAMIVNARLPGITARRADFEGVMTAWWGMYSGDPVRSTVELRSSLDLGDERYLTVHVRCLENSTGLSSNPETTLFVRDPATGKLKIEVVAE